MFYLPPSLSTFVNHAPRLRIDRKADHDGEGSPEVRLPSRDDEGKKRCSKEDPRKHTPFYIAEIGDADQGHAHRRHAQAGHDELIGNIKNAPLHEKDRVIDKYERNNIGRKGKPHGSPTGLDRVGLREAARGEDRRHIGRRNGRDTGEIEDKEMGRQRIDSQF